MTTTTVIRNASFVVGWDADESRHTYIPDGDVAFRDGAIVFVGRGYEGPADETIDGRGLMVMPGLVNIHSHPSSEPMNKGFLDELGSPALYNSSLYEYMPILGPDADAVADCVRVALFRTAALRRHDADRYVGRASGLARSRGRERDAHLPGADVPLGSLVHAQRSSGRI